MNPRYIRLTIMILFRHIGIEIREPQSPDHEWQTCQRNDCCESAKLGKHIVEAHVVRPDRDHKCHDCSHAVAV